ncbi:hypothetical protein VMCG_02688 [Cytospora schulzeri]|uniref:Protein BIG1 n=1 Tax=Cytospora schulzeri TaxID=448051 RepID=A0A423WZM7_9PEZI|nr:hypothetical protein VMCG_02688 [Valsa malicola]
MRFELTAASLLASTAAAFSDTSPFVLFSTSSNAYHSDANIRGPVPPLPSSKHPVNWPEDRQLVTTAQVSGLMGENLASCTTSRYVLISQPGVHASDLRHPATGKCLAPHLCEAATAPSVRTRFNAAEVVGNDFMSLEQMEGLISNLCADVRGEGGFVVEGHEFDALPEQKDMRSAKLIENDTKLGKIIKDTESSSDDYTVIYFSPPREGKSYESEYVESPAIQMELKRSTAGVMEPRAAKEGGNSSAPLFVKYQFFTPGIFMGLVAVLLMLSILYVGLSAVSSLQVPYGAFDKEMGPAAQKKNN